MTNGPFYEPRRILDELSDDATQLTEMTEWEHGFLCGLIKEYRPRKILEIGVSAGGTTAVILNSLSLLGIEGAVYSVDFLTYYYKDKTKKVGFFADEAKEKLGHLFEHVRHTLFSGSGVYDYLDEIGKEIDFLIIDTMHVCPGEILDFLACLPFLSKNAVVVLHDISMHFISNYYAYATQLLLDVVTGKKLVGEDPHSRCKSNYPNIGAFEINEGTRTNVTDVFSSLMIPWKYIPGDLNKYRDLYNCYYNADCLRLYDTAIANNTRLFAKRMENRIQGVTKLNNMLSELEGKRVYIYGEGKIGKILNWLLSLRGVQIIGHIVSDGEQVVEAIPLKDVSIGKDEVVVIGVGAQYIETIIRNLETKQINEYIVPDRLTYEEFL